MVQRAKHEPKSTRNQIRNTIHSYMRSLVFDFYLFHSRVHTPELVTSDSVQIIP